MTTRARTTRPTLTECGPGVMTQRSEQIAFGEVETLSWDDVLERVTENRRSP